MNYLAVVFPFLNRFPRLPFTRDQVMLLMVATNELFLGVDHYFAHLISGSLRPHEMIPIIFGPAAGIVLLAAGLIAMRRRDTASLLATFVLILSVGVGLLGWYFHLARTILPYAPAGQKVTIYLFIWAAPILGPLTASLIGVVGIIAAWREEPTGSGRLRLAGKSHIKLPLNKTQAYFMLVGLGALATLISSVLDHARTGFVNPWLWIPVGIGVFGTVVPIILGMLNDPKRSDLITYTAAMFLLIGVGMLGALLHVIVDYTAGGYQFVEERFIRLAPFMAPLLFSDMGALGMIVLLDPREVSTRS